MKLVDSIVILVCHYRRFLEGPNFMPWFQRRRAVAEQEQHRIWRQARSKADVETFLTSMTEVEVLDSFSAVERHLIIEMQVQIINSMFSIHRWNRRFQMHDYRETSTQLSVSYLTIQHYDVLSS